VLTVKRGEGGLVGTTPQVDGESCPWELSWLGLVGSGQRSWEYKALRCRSYAA